MCRHSPSPKQAEFYSRWILFRAQRMSKCFYSSPFVLRSLTWVFKLSFPPCFIFPWPWPGHLLQSPWLLGWQILPTALNSLEWSYNKTDNADSLLPILMTSHRLWHYFMLKVPLSTRRKDGVKQQRSRDRVICSTRQMFYHKSIIILEGNIPCWFL